MQNLQSFEKPCGLLMIVGEDQVQQKTQKTWLLSSSHFAFYRYSYNLIASLSRLEALFLDVTSDALENCSF